MDEFYLGFGLFPPNCTGQSFFSPPERGLVNIAITVGYNFGSQRQDVDILLRMLSEVFHNVIMKQL